MDNLSMELVALFGAVTGGMFAITTKLLGLLERVWGNRNGNGRSNPYTACQFHELGEAYKSAIFDVKRNSESLLHAVRNFEEDHDREQARLEQILQKQELILERLTTHFQDFRCMAQDVRGGIKRG